MRSRNEENDPNDVEAEGAATRVLSRSCLWPVEAQGDVRSAARV